MKTTSVQLPRELLESLQKTASVKGRSLASQIRIHLAECESKTNDPVVADSCDARNAELANYLLHISNDEANRLIGWILSDLAHTPALAELVANFRSYRETEAAKRGADFPERVDDREPQSSRCSSLQKRAGNPTN